MVEKLFFCFDLASAASFFLEICVADQVLLIEKTVLSTHKFTLTSDLARGFICYMLLLSVEKVLSQGLAKVPRRVNFKSGS